MTDSKQEAIEILAKGLGIAYSEGRLVTPSTVYAPRSRSEALYDRLVPLMQGEFPEKEIGLIISEYGRKVANDPDSEYVQLPSSDEFIVKIKCLIQGQSKGTCKTCGGSGKGGDMSMPRPEDAIVCPQCKGTGKERRSGCERRIEVRQRGYCLRRILADRRKC